MRIQNKKSLSNSKKKIMIIVAIVILLASSIAYLFYNKAIKDNANSNRNDAAQTDNAKNDLDKTAESSTDSSSTKGTDTNPSNQSPSGNQSPPSVTMESYSQENSQVTTVVNVTGDKVTNCIFRFSTADSKAVVRDVKVTGETCSAIVPEVEFSMTGLWQLNVTSYNGMAKVAETNQNVTIN